MLRYTFLNMVHEMTPRPTVGILLLNLDHAQRMLLIRLRRAKTAVTDTSYFTEIFGKVSKCRYIIWYESRN